MKPTLLCILDGVGLNPQKEGNAVAAANTPTLDRLLQHFPHTTLTTHGKAVGLPDGQMGNSEVGHLNIGAGRVVQQWLVRIEEAFANDTVRQQEVFQNFLKNRSKDGKIHLIGLYSFGGVHSDAKHLVELLKLLDQEAKGVELICHLITDGRDTSPKTLLRDLPILKKALSTVSSSVKIGSVIGRFYAMDRDKRWDRTEAAYRLISGAEQPSSSESIEPFEKIISLVEGEYAKGTTDEFLTAHDIEDCTMSSDDSVIFWNFRADRMRQLVRAFCDESFSEFTRTLPAFHAKQILTFTEYDKSLPLPVLFPHIEITNHLGSVVAQAGIKQLRSAETEKYPHVTYFLNGGVEQQGAGEGRILVPSPRDVKTYDEKPEMSAFEVTRKILAAIRDKDYGLIVLNFANGDMVGHTGDLKAATRAVEVVDQCLGEILEAVQKKGGEALVIADHGNAEQMVNYETGDPHTAHTTHPVPAILVSERYRDQQLRTDGALCDVAPTVLELLGITQPEEMTGRSLIAA